MKIFITGGCGFIGSNYIIENISNHQILNFDMQTYAGINDNLVKIVDSHNYSFIRGDICDFDIIFESILHFKPDVILHFAAESHVDRSIDLPMTFVNTNILGTATLLNAALLYYKKTKNAKFRFIHVSTDEVYGSLRNTGLFTENSAYAPNSPYSASKASSDHLVRAWQKTYDLPAIITNCSNNYGPYQFAEKLIPLMIANCLDEKSLPIYGEGLNIRDWIFVKDHCNAINKILINGAIGETYNIGANNEIKNIDIVKTVCSLLDEFKPRKNGLNYEKLITYVADRPGHDFRYAIDCSKIKKETGWIPRETFSTGIRKTIKWYLDNEDWWRNIQKKNYNQERHGIKKE